MFDEKLPNPVIVLTSIRNPENNAFLKEDGSKKHFIKSQDDYSRLAQICEGILQKKNNYGQVSAQDGQPQDGLLVKGISRPALINTTPGTTILIDLNGTIIMAEESVANAFGVQQSELIGRNIFDLLPPDLRETRQKAVARAVETCKPVVIVDFNLGRYLRTHIHPIPNENGTLHRVVLLIMDITDQVNSAEIYQRRDAILQEVNFASERFLQSSSWREHVPEVLKRWSEATNVHRAFIYQCKNLPSGERYYELFNGWHINGPSDKIVQEKFLQFSLKEIGFSDIEEALVRGETVQLRISTVSPEKIAFFQQNDAKALLHVPIFVDDCYWGFIGFADCEVAREWSSVELDAIRTSANILSAALKREQEELSRAALLDALPDLMFLFDRNGTYIDYHAQDPELLVLPPDQLLGKSIYEALPPAVAKLACDAFEKTVLTGTPQFFEYELPIKNARYWEGRMVRSGDGAVAVIRDITKRRSFEEELRLSEKSIGDLYEITSSNELDFDEKQHALLKMGCQRFGMEIGYILQLKKDFFELMHLYTSI